MWLLVGYGDVLEPPLSVKSSQPHVRSFWLGNLNSFVCGFYTLNDG